MQKCAFNGKQENTNLNELEYRSQEIILRSTPRYITIGAHYGCNAHCVFCLGGKYPNFSMNIYKNLFEKKMLSVLKQAEHVGFCGFGEILLMPDIECFLDHINVTLDGAIKNFTTNGIALTPLTCAKLVQGKYAVMVSLHASNRELHERLTGTKYFDTIIKNIRRLIKLRKGNFQCPHVNLVFLATTLNISDLPAFVKLAYELNVDRVTCNYFTIYDKKQVKLSCFNEKKKTNAIFDEAESLARELGVTLILPPRFGSRGGGGGNPLCRNPWEFFYVETQGSVNPCCFAGDNIGLLNKTDFSSIWNSSGYTKLRAGLVSGKIHSWCRYCYQNDMANIDDIRSHITFRPKEQKRILEYIGSLGYEYSSIEKKV